MECFSKIRPQPYPTGGEEGEREYRDVGLVCTGLLKRLSLYVRNITRNRMCTLKKHMCFKQTIKSCTCDAPG